MIFLLFVAGLLLWSSWVLRRQPEIAHPTLLLALVIGGPALLAAS